MGNRYVQAMGGFYDSTPKSVFAALAYSYVSIMNYGETDPAKIIEQLRREWGVLNAQNIIPQEVPKP